MNPRQMKVQDAARFIRQSCSLRPTFGLVLGSGFGSFVDDVKVAASWTFREIPGFPPTSVVGHQGRFVIGLLEGQVLAILQGRLHLYEGHDADQVCLGVRMLGELGCRDLLLTNAAGGIAPQLRTGSWMILRDHLNLTGQNPLCGSSIEAWGPRFPDMGEIYKHAWSDELRAASRTSGIHLEEGVLAGLLGPSYETPAEVQMLKILGADAVGMSTVLEAIAAHHRGMRVAGLSCIANSAAGLQSGQLSHGDVEREVLATVPQLSHLISSLLRARQSSAPEEKNRKM